LTKVDGIQNVQIKDKVCSFDVTKKDLDPNATLTSLSETVKPLKGFKIVEKE